MILIEKVHRRFRGSSEVAKFFKSTAFLIDCASGIFACLGIFGEWTYSYLPLIIFLMAIFSSILRWYADKAKAFAQTCRKTALRSYSFGKNIDSLTENNLEIAEPFFTEFAADRLPAQTVMEYYETTQPVGELRMRELYAHSAFYTWRLLKSSSILVGIFSFLLFILCFSIIYRFAEGNFESSLKKAVLEALCTIALVLIFIRSLEFSLKSKSSFQNAMEVESKLLMPISGDELLSVVDTYEIERSSGADPSTIIYLFMRNRLQRQWIKRRKSIQ